MVQGQEPEEAEGRCKPRLACLVLPMQWPVGKVGLGGEAAALQSVGLFMQG